MRKVAVVVDGLNLFHALRSQNANSKLLDVHSFSSRVINRNTETISEISYFSAQVAHLGGEALDQQRRYFERLNQSGVRIELGEFKAKSVRCLGCGSHFTKHEEKQTDVNIALKLSELARSGSVEKILLFSADTDLIPALKVMQKTNPELETWMVSTKSYLRPIHSATKNLVKGYLRISDEIASAHQFD